MLIKWYSNVIYHFSLNITCCSRLSRLSSIKLISPCRNSCPWRAALDNRRYRSNFHTITTHDIWPCLTLTLTTFYHRKIFQVVLGAAQGWGGWCVTAGAGRRAGGGPLCRSAAVHCGTAYPSGSRLRRRPTPGRLLACRSLLLGGLGRVLLAWAIIQRRALPQMLSGLSSMRKPNK